MVETTKTLSAAERKKLEFPKAKGGTPDDLRKVETKFLSAKERARLQQNREAQAKAAREVEQQLKKIEKFGTLENFRKEFQNLPQFVRGRVNTTPQKVERELQQRQKKIDQKVQNLRQRIETEQRRIKEERRETDIESAEDRAELREDVEKRQADIADFKERIDTFQEGKKQLQQGKILSVGKIEDIAQRRGNVISDRKTAEAEAELKEFRLRKQAEEKRKQQPKNVTATVVGGFDTSKAGTFVKEQRRQGGKTSTIFVNPRTDQRLEFSSKKAVKDLTSEQKIQLQAPKPEQILEANKTDKLSQRDLIGLGFSKSEAKLITKDKAPSSKDLQDVLKKENLDKTAEELRKQVKDFRKRRNLVSRLQERGGPQATKTMLPSKADFTSVKVSPSGLQQLQQRQTITPKARKALQDLSGATEVTLGIPSEDQRFLNQERLVNVGGLGTMVLTSDGKLRGLTQTERKDIQGKRMFANPVNFGVGAVAQANDYLSIIESPGKIIEGAKAFANAPVATSLLTATALKKELETNPFKLLGRFALDYGIGKGAGTLFSFVNKATKPVQDNLRKVKVFSEDKVKQADKILEELKKEGYGERSRPVQEVKQVKKVYENNLKSLTTSALKDLSDIQQAAKQADNANTPQQFKQAARKVQEKSRQFNQKTKKFQNLKGPNFIRDETKAKGLRELFGGAEPLKNTVTVRNLRKSPLKIIRENPDNPKTVANVLEANQLEQNFKKLRQEAERVTGKKAKISQSKTNVVDPFTGQSKKRIQVELIEKKPKQQSKKGQNKKDKGKNVVKTEPEQKEFSKQQNRTIRQFEREAEREGLKVTDEMRDTVARNRSLFASKKGSARLAPQVSKGFKNKRKALNKEQKVVQKDFQKFVNKYDLGGGKKVPSAPKERGGKPKKWSKDLREQYVKERRQLSEKANNLRREIAKDKRFISTLTRLASAYARALSKANIASSLNKVDSKLASIQEQAKTFQAPSLPQLQNLQKGRGDGSQSQKPPGNGGKGGNFKPTLPKPGKGGNFKPTQPKPGKGDFEKPSRPRRLRIPRLNNLPRTQNTRQGYLVKVKSGGKVVAATDTPLPRKRAQNFGREIVSGKRGNFPLSASFSVQRKGTTNIQDVEKIKFKNQFRTKKGDDPRVQRNVERRKFRIDTKKEKKAIQKARNRKK